ncbi:MAG: insulinase family protein, partial [Fusobacteriaceae bacterium]
NNSEYQKPEKFDIKPTKENNVVFTDPEITDTSFQLATSGVTNPLNNQLQIKNHFLKSLFGRIMSSRFSVITKEKNSPIVGGGANVFRFGDFNEFSMISSQLKEEKVLDGITQTYEQIKILADYGPYKEELENSKKEELANAENYANNKNTIDNQVYVQQLNDVVTYGDTFLNMDENLKYTKKALSSITEKDIQEFAKKFYESSKLNYLSMPKKESLKIPTAQDIEKIKINTKNKKLENFKKPENGEIKFVEVPAGKILISEVLNLSGNPVIKGEFFEVLKYNLSNGIQVYHKNTTFEEDKISIKIFKEEGNSNNNLVEYINSGIATEMLSSSGIGNLSPNEFENFMKGKNFNITPYITDYEQGIVISSDKKNLETAIDTTITMFMNNKFDDNIFEVKMQARKENIMNRLKSPDNNFDDLIAKKLYNNNPRRTSVTLKDLEKINKQEILKIYNDKFSNFAGYKIIIVGSGKYVDIRKIVSDKFAGLPTDEKNSKTFKNLGIKFPSGIIKDSIKSGEDKKSKVRIYYPIKAEYSKINRDKLSAFTELLKIILIEKIREERGDVYSISAGWSFEYMNHGENYFVIGFSADDKKSDDVAETTKKVFADVIAGKYDEKKLNIVYENYKLNYETSLLQNGFWMNYIYKYSFDGNKNYKILSPEEFKSLNNYESLKDFANKFIDQKNYVQLTLKPAK